MVVGICGAQGSGKSTLTEQLRASLSQLGLTVAALSLDDLYLTRRERTVLARDVHPLLLTRGVPGTHDVDLGLSLFENLATGNPVRLPRFDKARDDRAPESTWEPIDKPVDVLLFEGWCVGAKPEPAWKLREPINSLERDEDPHGIWRAYVNSALKGPYQRLFAFEFLILLAAPDWDVVLKWRTQQEEALRASAEPGAVGIMDGPALARFVQHYERLTRYILEEMPAQASLSIQLSADRAIQHIRANP